MISLPTIIEFGCVVTTCKHSEREDNNLRYRRARQVVHDHMRQGIQAIRTEHPDGRWIERPVIVEVPHTNPPICAMGWYGAYLPAVSP